MKPRLRYRWGTWACGLVSSIAEYPFYMAPIGYGHTPREAFEDWKSAWRAQQC
jgi:hypothetical protein